MTLPRVTTETGWVTSGSGAITQEQQGRIFLNLYLSAFKQGFSYTFIYMLRDDPSQGYWGLFDTSYTPKKSGTYLHNLTTILAGSGTRTPGKLDYSDRVGARDRARSAAAEERRHVRSRRVGRAAERRVATWSRSTSARRARRSPCTTRRRARRRRRRCTSVSSVALTLSDHPVVIEL